MPNYTSVDNVLMEIPADDLDDETEFKAKIAAWIPQKSAYVDSALPGYAEFKAFPATPPAIEEIARLLVVDQALRYFKLERRDPDDAVETYRQQAERMLRQLADGERVIPLSQL
ncbi:hypothetical protein D3C87_655850 [compost metagenome]